MKAAEKAKLRRSLGIGVTNYAYWLAKNGLFYSNGSANNATHRLFESIQFSLLKASMQLAEEKGACGMFDRTKYAKGLLPIDHYKKEVDDVHSQALLKDWEWLRGEIAKQGLRNSTLTAQMPCETSSQITNSTNGIEPPRGLVSVKASKDGVFKQVVPESNTLFYELLWDIPSNQGYLELNAIMQKFIDQSISTNTNYDPEKFADGKVPITQLIKDLVLAYKLGIKTLYYHNTRDGSGDAQQDDGCASGACKL
jgi:ribonucleoside-diphosphate reductase alpha chain